MRYLSPFSENLDQRDAATNRTLSRTKDWTDEDWAVLCRAENRGRVFELHAMLGAELCDEIPLYYQGIMNPPETAAGKMSRKRLSPLGKLRRAISWAGGV